MITRHITSNGGELSLVGRSVLMLTLRSRQVRQQSARTGAVRRRLFGGEGRGVFAGTVEAGACPSASDGCGESIASGNVEQSADGVMNERHEGNQADSTQG